MEPIARPISAATLPLDPAGRIDTDIPCRKCGYNLRGLLPDGVCPECATAVGRSLHGDLLRFCDPDWVQTLASGMNWIVAGIVASIVLGCMGGGLTGILGAVRPGIAAMPIMASRLVGALIVFVGYWRVTTPDPGRVEEESSRSARKLVRVAQVAGIALLPSNVAAGFIPASLQVLLMIGSAVVGIAGVFAIFVYARQLASRIPDDKLARNTRIVMWGSVVVVAMFAVTMIGGIGMLATLPAGGGTFVTTTSTSAPAGGAWVTRVNVSPSTMPVTTTFAVTATARGLSFGTLMGFAGCGAGIGVLVFGVWSLVLIDRYRKALRESAEIARQTWASETSAPRPPA